MTDSGISQLTVEGVSLSNGCKEFASMDSYYHYKQIGKLNSRTLRQRSRKEFSSGCKAIHKEGSKL